MTKTTDKLGCLEGNINVADDFGVPLPATAETVSAVTAPEGEELTVEQQNEIMGKALRDIVDIFMTFDYPSAEDFGMIARRALKRVGRL